VVVIEQADPNTMYVPYYDPATVYGSWPYAEYPPYYFGYPSYIGAGVVAAGLAFGAGWAIGRWGNYWGGGCNWGNRNVYVNHFNRTTNIGNSWQHNPSHRQGVRYNNTNVAQKFGNNNLKAGAADRMDFRGRDGQQVLKDRPGAGDRAGDRGGDRAGVADRAGDRGGDRAGDRGGDRAGAADRAKGGGDRAKGGGKGGNKAAAKGGGDRAKAANRAGNAARGGGGNRGGAMNVSSGRAAAAASARGRSSMASMPRGGGGGGGMAMRGGGGGGFGGGGGRGGGGGGGRRSDIALKHDIVLLGHLANGLGYYRFSYLGSHKAYVGVMAQEVENVMPEAVTRGSDGYLRVTYEKLGLKFRTYSDWLAGGARIPAEVTP
jgi:hypothetical protein